MLVRGFEQADLSLSALSQTLFDAWKGCNPACSREITRWYAPPVYKAILFWAVIVPIIMNPSTSTTVTFVPGKRGALNAVVDGYRYTKNRTYKENVYYRCAEQSTWSARIPLTDGVLSSPIPDHSHPSQEAAIAVLGMKNHIKKRSAETDMPTKEIVTPKKEDELWCLDQLIM